MKSILLSMSLLLTVEIFAASADDKPSVAITSLPAQRLFQVQNGDTVPYRIPAIASIGENRLLAVGDYRWCHSDIGYGRVDLHCRISDDGGKTWGVESILASGDGIERGNVWQYAFGDCAIVADREGQEVVVVCVGGKMVYSKGTRENPNRLVRFRSHDGGETWDKGYEITEQIYSLFDNRKDGPVQSMFVGSGKIHQSRYVKVGRYYRLYAALCTKQGNFVIYSDDFAENWSVLGSGDFSCCPDGDEPKCEELPDGSVVLSSRANGRLFNVFTYTDVRAATGRWDERAIASAFAGISNQCNGEILIAECHRVLDSAPVFIALQSVPFGPGRSNVGFFYRELGNASLSAADFASGWKRGLQMSHEASAYSTMVRQKDGSIAFFWEEGPVWEGCGYNLDFAILDICQITEGQYR